MSLKRIFWSMLAGVSFSLAGCEEENPPADTATDDIQAEEAADVQHEDAVTEGQDIHEVADVAADDGLAETEFPPVEYGPPPDL